MAEDNTPTNVVDDIKLSGSRGGNTTPTGVNIVYANVEDLEQFIQFDRKAEGNVEKINKIKKTILDKGYLFDTGYDAGVVIGVSVDELGNVQIQEANNRLYALLDVAKETGQGIYVPINPILESTGAGNKVELTSSDNAYNSMKQLLTDMLEGNKNFDLDMTINEKLGEPGRKIVELESYTYPGGKPGTSTNQSNIKKFFNSIGLNTITYDELPDNNIYKTGVNTFIDTPTNVVDDVTELENSIRTKYSDYLEEDTIRGYSGSLENPFVIDVPIYEKRGIQLDYFEGDPTKNFPYNKDTLFIKYLYIDETQRGQGIGSQIFDEIKQFADNNGLYIRLKNDKNFNTNFWNKKGFGIYEGDKSADYVYARLDDYVLAPEGETLPDTPNRLDTPTNVVDDIKLTDPPGGSLGAAKLNDPLVFDSWVDNYAKTTTSFIDNLPLSTTVKNQFNNLVKGRAKNLATPGGVADAVDVWELGVLGLMIAAVAFKEYDEVPKILTNKAVDMFNSMTAPYNIPPVPKEQYDLDYEFINKVVETGEKFMPTDIIIKKVGEVIEGVGEKGLATGFGYVPTTPEKTDTMETKQKIQPGVQEEKMFEQAKPKKVKSGGGSGARIL